VCVCVSIYIYIYIYIRILHWFWNNVFQSCLFILEDADEKLVLEKIYKKGVSFVLLLAFNF
jgi:hypothetical protein